MVVLDEVGIDAGRFPEHAAVEALVEEAALVAEDLRLQHEDVGNVGTNDVHGWQPANA